MKFFKLNRNFNLIKQKILLSHKKILENQNFILGNEVNKLEKIFLWGVAAKIPILKYYPELKDKIKIVGNPRMDKMCVYRNNRNSNKNIGLITRFSLFNDFQDRKPIDKLVSFSA